MVLAGREMLKIVSLLCVLWSRALGQAPCLLSNVSLQANFDITQFLGKWYEIEWIAPAFYDGGDLWINYYHVYSADDFGVVTGYYSGKDPNTNQCYLGGLANLKTNDDPSRMMQYTEGSKSVGDYWILDTDYTTYAVAYSCVVKADDNSDTCVTARSWLWSRTKSLPEQVKATARSTFSSLCMNMTLLYVTDHAGQECVPSSTSRGTAITAASFTGCVTVLSLAMLNLVTSA